MSGYARVWVSGRLVAEHTGSFLPLVVDLDTHWIEGAVNAVIVQVDNRHRETWLPGSAVVEWPQYGGLLKSVSLMSTPLCRISEVSVTRLETAEISRILVEAEITNGGAVGVTGLLRASVGSHFQTQPATLAAGESARISLELALPGAAWWSLEHPVLHELDAAWVEEGEVVHQRTVRFGIRKIEVKGHEILLNGEAITLRGVNRYDDYGDLGLTPPPDLLRADLVRIKQTGANLVRTHYPPSPEQLDLLDEIGLLLMEEVPLNWWLGADPTYRREVVDLAEEVLEGIIQRDGHHPCIIAWSMANESETHRPEGIAAMRRLMRRARERDPSRLVTFVTKGEPGQQAFDEADLVCINLYYGLFSGESRVCRLSEMDELVRQPTAAHLRRAAAEFPGKPVVLTEFGTCGIAPLRGAAPYSETFQSAYLEAVWRAVGDADIQGGVVWSWADYPHRPAFRHTVWDTPYGPFGLVTQDRRAKESLATMCRIFGGNPELMTDTPRS